MNPYHYPDLERCKKLTELGFPKTEKTWWIYSKDKFVIRTPIELELECIKTFRIWDYYPKQFIACPSVMEMLDVIPKVFTDSDMEREELTILYHKKGIDVWYAWFDIPIEERMINGDTLPNALADLIVWLVENGHITFDKR